MRKPNKTYDTLEYIAYVVDEFAIRHEMTDNSAYAYLNRYGGIDFLIDCYEAEHTLSLQDAVQDIQEICQRNGGKIV